MKRLSLVVLCGLLACNVNAAEAMKVGIVNLDEVIVKAPLAVSYGEKLSSDFKPRQDALDTAQRKLQDDVNQLTFNGFKMTADDRNKLTQTINAEKVEVDSLGTALQKDFVAARNNYSQQMLTRLNTVISRWSLRYYSDQHKYVVCEHGC
jgi:Skp family chaperone for outer membrane proteins